MSDIAHYLSRRPNQQPPIFEQALIDCIDIFSMAGISETIRFKLIKDILISTKAEDDRFKRENKMRVPFRLPQAEPAKYRTNLSQIFYACYKIASTSGNPSPKSIEIRNIIEKSDLFYHFKPTEDYWVASRRGKKPRGPSHKSPPSIAVEDIDTGLIETINLEEIIPPPPPPPEEVVVPKVTIVHEAEHLDNAPGLNITLPPRRRQELPTATEGTDPAPEPYTPD
jgi:hypothetical protein